MASICWRLGEARGCIADGRSAAVALNAATAATAAATTSTRKCVVLLFFFFFNFTGGKGISMFGISFSFSFSSFFFPLSCSYSTERLKRTNEKAIDELNK